MGSRRPTPVPEPGKPSPSAVPRPRRLIEQHFSQLVAGVSDYAIFLLDPEGRVATWNAGAERIKGYAPREILGKHFSLFYTPEAVAAGAPDRALRTATAQGRFADEGLRVRKDGTRFWASVAITPVHDDEGQISGYFKITRDLTERRKAEMSLRESEERFRLLVDGVLDYAIFMLTPEGNVDTWNQGAQRLKGYKASEIIGKHFSVFYPPDAIASGKPAWELRQAIEQGRIEDEGWRIRKDGTRFWANVLITALRGEDGRLRGFAKVTRDLTERRQIEKLQEIDHQKNQFLAMLAHELRNPLAPMRTALHIVGNAEAPPEHVARGREIAEHQVAHMSRLLDDLIDVSRIGEGAIELRRETVDVASLIVSAVQRARHLAQERQLELSVDGIEGSLFVEADPTRLDQVLNNLLTNAAKYTDPGGRIGVSAQREGPDAVLRVRDTGIGIDASMVPRIFDLFVQAERRVDRSVGGVGVGLTLVKKLVEMHGGSVEARSSGPGKGSEFIVRLPCVAPRAAPSPARAAESRRERRTPLRVLIADDNPEAADALGMLLEMDGDAVRVAYDGVSALRGAETFRPNAVLLDIGMPGLDGYEVARRMRASEATRDCLLVAISGWGTPEDRKRSFDAGFNHHLVKPFDLGALDSLLRTYSASLARNGRA
ncbi:MAG TPA: PAS domain S-box protein [Thermoanaerobaculia bacterium]